MIIGLSGYARSGKDTVAGMLIGLHKYDNRAFADEVRQFLTQINPVLEDGHRLNEIVGQFGWEYAKARTEVRRLLQVVGLEVRNFFGENCWVDRAMIGVSSSQKIVFTDVRFPNEAEMIKALGGEIWRIQRPGIAPINNHPSESAMDDWQFDKMILNSSGVEGLKQQIAAAFK